MEENHNNREDDSFLSDDERRIVRGGEESVDDEGWDFIKDDPRRRDRRSHQDEFDERRWTGGVAVEGMGFPQRNDTRQNNQQRGVIEHLEIENRTLSILGRIARQRKCSLYEVCRMALRNYVSTCMEYSDGRGNAGVRKKHGRF